MKKNMMRKTSLIFGMAVLVAALFFTACANPNNSENAYTVHVAALQHGSVTASPAAGEEGTIITLTVSPESGYWLKDESLKYSYGSTTVAITGNSFTLPAANVTVTAEFELIPAGTFTVTVAALQHGSITASPTKGEEGTEITLTINPESGYWIKEGSLKYSTGAATVAITGNRFDLPAAHVTVTAEFEIKTAAELLAVGTQALEEGNISAASGAFEAVYRQDPNNNKAIIYSSLGALASIATDQNVRKLVINRLGLTNYPGTIDGLLTADWMETYNGESLVRWYYEDERSYSWYDPEDEWDARTLNLYGLPLQAGYYYVESLEEAVYTFVAGERKTGPLDSYYDEDLYVWVYWYDWEPDGGQGPGYYYYSDDGSGRHIYEFVGGTRKIGLLDDYYDEDLGVWAYWHDSVPGGGGQGPGYYWHKWNAFQLVSVTPRYDTWTSKMPGLSRPAWFTETETYKDNLTSAGAFQASQWQLLFFANLLDKNQAGLNDLLDDVLSSVFGAAFEDAAGRFENLPYDQSIQVDAGIIEAFGLSGIFEGDELYIGKAELSLLFSAVRLFKASLEWVAAYDWNTDISFLKTDWNTLEDNIGTLSPRNLPFGNTFLKDRNNGKMAASKADFDKALADAIAAYEHLISAASKLPDAYIDEMKAYEWLKDGLSKLKTAIKNGETFYVPEQEPQGSTYNNSAANALVGVNMGKLFTPGQFAIDQLITTESGGKAPQFYAFKDDTAVAITSKAQMDALGEGSYIGFRLKLDRIREVVVTGLGEFLPAEENTLDMPLFPARIGKDLYGLYHK
jgi:hypothetical protein